MRTGFKVVWNCIKESELHLYVIRKDKIITKFASIKYLKQHVVMIYTLLHIFP